MTKMTHAMRMELANAVRDRYATAAHKDKGRILELVTNAVRQCDMVSYMALMEACLVLLRGKDDQPGTEAPAYRVPPPALFRVDAAMSRIRALVAGQTEEHEIDFVRCLPTVRADVLGLTADIVAAHVGHNQVSADALPAMIQEVYRALAKVELPDAAPKEAPTPAVPIKRSVFPDYIVCLEDGKKLKMLKRHLQTSYGLTPAGYRAKWGLPADYPMVAPSYASTRSSLAKSAGLGRKRSAAQGEPDPVQLAEPQPPVDEPEITVGKARRARGSRG